ncbi:hypothetical protein V2J09_017973 [Rumex salicifolius]
MNSNPKTLLISPSPSPF